MRAGSAAVADLTGDRLAEVAEAALAREDLREAIALFDRAEPGVVDPDRCAGGRWMAHMLAGNFEGAWLESDAVRKRGAPDPHRFWHGENLRGRRLMLRCLHGYGDAVQMFRFLPRLREIVSALTVEVPPRLAELAACFAGMGEVITWGEGAPAEPPPWDVQMEIMELPYALRVRSDELAPAQEYLQLPLDVRKRAAQVLGERRLPRVGLAWCAGHWNPLRSVPFTELKQFLAMDRVEFWSLQGDPERRDWLALGGDAAERDVYACGDGILPLTAAIHGMDLVITVDTLAAHLAGALGVPCWVLLQQRADWRWMAKREDSPWYPSVRLWRQAATGDWGELITRVCAALRAGLRSGTFSGKGIDR